MSNLYSAATGVPSSGMISLSNFYGKSSSIPAIASDTLFSVNAYSLSNLASNASVSSWGVFTQSNSSKTPTYIKSTPPCVRFYGDQFNAKWLTYSSNMTIPYTSGGGSTTVMLGRYNQYYYPSCTIAHDGVRNTSNPSGTFEWVFTNTNLLKIKYYFTDVNGIMNSNTADVPTSNLSLYVARFNNSNGTLQLFRNNVQIAARQHPSLVDADIAYFSIGGNNGPPGSRTDVVYASMYARPLSDAELTTIYQTYSNICQA
jgi:hypothetical protein